MAIDAIALLPTAATTPEDMNSRILIFSFAFLFLITAWLIYTTYMSVLPVDTMPVTFLNVALLLLVALIPYLLNNVELGDNAAIRDYSSSLFALDLAGILGILAIFAHVLGAERKGLVPPESARLFRNGRKGAAPDLVLVGPGTPAREPYVQGVVTVSGVHAGNASFEPLGGTGLPTRAVPVRSMAPYQGARIADACRDDY